MRQIPGRNLGKAAYTAQITILLAGIAAEEIVFGDHADGAGGSDDSDLRQATLIAATMEVSLGLGSSLIYLCSRRPDGVLARLRADPMLRQLVEQTLDECFQRARSIIAERAAAFERLVQILLVSSHLPAEIIEREINAPRG